jgi:hypothetical protein
VDGRHTQWWRFRRPAPKREQIHRVQGNILFVPA